MQLARSNNDKHLENEALERLRIHENNAIAAKAQMYQYTDRAEFLKRHSTILERKLVEAKSKKDLSFMTTTSQELLAIAPTVPHFG